MLFNGNFHNWCSDVVWDEGTRASIVSLSNKEMQMHAI